jgi:tRNA A-37 threonylcarbamoyl transferase component Bud32/tetratricopeptide (TPR) repeat protein
LANKCPTCHSDNPDTLKFCGECGIQLLPPYDHPPIMTETLQTPVRELTTGSTFAGRYQVIEELGHGGMGRVYKVQDTDIKEKVALKLLRPEITLDKETVERFSNELKLARKISHRNVCRMFDLGRAEGTTFITMEFVPGEDLKSFLHRAKQLSIGTAISIARQVCEGLEEAHRLGVVHRDLKPGNIMIDKDGDAKIMDFGIARSLSGIGITGAGVLIGTPEYMSPEQVEGKDVDQRSDLYSLGIILYEMVTGRLPFAGDTPLSVAHKHKYEAPKNPKLLNPNIPDDLSGLILKSLEKDKTQRYQSAADLRAELERIERGLPTTERVAPQKKPSTSKQITVSFRPAKLLIPAVAIIAVIAAAIIFWPKKAPDLDPKRVAVAVFENETGDSKLDPVGRLAADMVIQALRPAGLFSVAPLSMAETMPDRAKGKNRLRLLAEETKAGKIVSGTYYLQGESIQFHAKITDIANNKDLLDLEPVTGPVKEPSQALETLRSKLLGGLAMIFDPSLKEDLLFIGEPPKYDAYLEYIDGCVALGRADYPKAIASFQRSATLDPDFKEALLAEGFAYWMQGQYAKAQELFANIEKARESLPAFGRYMLDLNQASLRGDLEGAHSAAGQIVALYPARIDAIINKASSALCLNYPQEVVDSLSKIDLFDKHLPEDEKGFTRSLLTTAYHMLGNHKEELKVARGIRKAYPRLLSSLSNEAPALAALGRVKDLQILIEESKTLPPQSGYSLGLIMLDSGRQLRAHGYKKAAVQILNQAAQWFEGLPQAEKATVANRDILSRAFYALDKWDEAESLIRILHNELPVDTVDGVDEYAYLGLIAARKGDREKALKISQELKDNKSPYLFGHPTYWRARIAALLGDKEGAVQLLQEAIKQGVDYQILYLYPQDFESLQDYPSFQQLMKPKG